MADGSKPVEDAGTGALSMDAAIELLANGGAPVVDEAEEPVAEEPGAAPETDAQPDTDTPAEPEAEDVAAPPEEAASGEEDAGQAEPAAEEQPAIEPPHSWDAEHKAKFAALPRDVQEYLTARESDRDKAVSTATREAAEARTKADADLKMVGDLATRLNEFLPEAIKTFQGRWGEKPDWNKVMEMHGAEEAFRLKAQYETEQDKLNELKAHAETTQNLKHQEFVRGELQKLETVSPTMAGAAGAQLRGEVGAYAVQQGWASPEDLRHVSAHQLEMARKAMLYDKAQALKAAPASAAPPAPAASPRPAPRPAATPAARPSSAPSTTNQQRTTDALNRRLSQTGRIEDAVKLMVARQQGN